MNLERMTNDQLYDRVWEAINAASMERGVSKHGATANVLRTLGLDRIDLAVERAAEALWERDHGPALFGHGEASSPTYLRGIYRSTARAVLEAALTATEGAESDG